MAGGRARWSMPCGWLAANLRPAPTRPRPRARLHRPGGRARGGRPRAAQRLGPAPRARAPAGWPSSSPRPTGCRRTPRLRTGHIVKARYTPQQQMFLAVDEQDSPHHAVMTSGLAAAGDLLGMPVVVADLHSALPAILAGIRVDRPGARVVYLMTDGGALPIAFSRNVADPDRARLAGRHRDGRPGLRRRPRGRHPALRPARRQARPGRRHRGRHPGTRQRRHGHPLGLHRASRRARPSTRSAPSGGRGVAALRVSDADPRERHRGISHHSTTAYGRICLVAADLPLPTTGDEFGALVRRAGPRAGAHAPRAPSRSRDVDPDGLDAALRAVPVTLSTMGRGLDEDHAAFLYSAAAGRYAARLLES